MRVGVGYSVCVLRCVFGRIACVRAGVGLLITPPARPKRAVRSLRGDVNAFSVPRATTTTTAPRGWRAG